MRGITTGKVRRKGRKRIDRVLLFMAPPERGIPVSFFTRCFGSILFFEFCIYLIMFSFFAIVYSTPRNKHEKKTREKALSKIILNF
jgi:hypothetical protein